MTAAAPPASGRQGLVGATVILLLLSASASVQGDYYSKLLSNTAEDVFNPNKASAVAKPAPVRSSVPSDLPRVDVPEGADGTESLQDDLAAIIKALKSKDGDKKPEYKQVLNVLKYLLEEDAEKIETEVKETAVRDGPNEQAALQFEEKEYSSFKQKVQDAEELEGEFDAAQDMADNVAEDYGEDIEMTMADQSGNEYMVDSDLNAAKAKKKAPGYSQMGQKAKQLADEVKQGNGTIGAEALTNEDVGQWVDEMDQAYNKAADDVDIDEDLEYDVMMDEADLVEEEAKLEARAGAQPVHGDFMPKVSQAVIEQQHQDAQSHVALAMSLMGTRSPRAQFQVSVLSKPDPDMPAFDDENSQTSEHYRDEVAWSIMKDLETLGAQIDSRWEHRVGMIYQVAYTEKYAIMFQFEVIFPVYHFDLHNNERAPIEFLDKLMQGSEGSFAATMKEWPNLVVTPGRYIEFCAADGSVHRFYSPAYKNETGLWEEEVLVGPDREISLCWSKEEDIAAAKQALIIGGLAASVPTVMGLFALVCCCCWCRKRRSRGGDPDEPETNFDAFGEAVLGRQRFRALSPMAILGLRRKSSWRHTADEFLPEEDEEKPSTKMQRLAEKYGAKTYLGNDIDGKYGKKFNKGNKYGWVSELRQSKRRSSPKGAHDSAGSSGDEGKEPCPDIPVSYSPGGGGGEHAVQVEKWSPLPKGRGPARQPQRS